VRERSSNTDASSAASPAGATCPTDSSRSQPISISRKPLETVPHVVQPTSRFGLITRRSRVRIPPRYRRRPRKWGLFRGRCQMAEPPAGTKQVPILKFALSSTTVFFGTRSPNRRFQVRVRAAPFDSLGSVGCITAPGAGLLALGSLEGERSTKVSKRLFRTLSFPWTFPESAGTVSSVTRRTRRDRTRRSEGQAPSSRGGGVSAAPGASPWRAGGVRRSGCQRRPRSVPSSVQLADDVYQGSAPRSRRSRDGRERGRRPAS
jgi:hypothetical protein